MGYWARHEEERNLVVDGSRAWRVVKRLLFAATVSIATLAGVFLWAAVQEFSVNIPPLLAGLNGTAEEMAAQGTSRLATMFPAGTEERELIEVLSSQGFRPSWKWTQADRIAEISVSAFVCTNYYEVQWAIDDVGKIKTVSLGPVGWNCL